MMLVCCLIMGFSKRVIIIIKELLIIAHSRQSYFHSNFNFVDIQILMASSVSKFILKKLLKNPNGLLNNIKNLLDANNNNKDKLFPVISTIREDPFTVEPINICNFDINIPNIVKLHGDLNIL
jgi:hypothetical protein